ncbi:hypothetical protein BX600DRAFT_514802 [Xylariales sp. PMI_506]|nr:hypothetical protein BX600DRAFT_514802 [Xylariales sp. PMI_506]
MLASTSATEDLGCLTNDGQWTDDDETLCGTFTAVAGTDSGSVVVSSATGPCVIAATTGYFDCGSDNTVGQSFYPLAGALADYTILEYGDLSYTYYGMGDATAAPTDIKIIQTGSATPYIWLAWASS